MPIQLYKLWFKIQLPNKAIAFDITNRAMLVIFRILKQIFTRRVRNFIFFLPTNKSEVMEETFQGFWVINPRATMLRGVVTKGLGIFKNSKKWPTNSLCRQLSSSFAKVCRWEMFDFFLREQVYIKTAAPTYVDSVWREPTL